MATTLKMSPRVRKNNTSNTTVNAQLTAAHWSGPLPHPDDLDRFNLVVEGSAERILRMAEEQQSHRHKIEINQAECNILAIRSNSDTQLAEARAVMRGHYLGSAISISSIIASVVTSIMGAPWQVSVALVGVPVMGAVQAFLKHNQ